MRMRIMHYVKRCYEFWCPQQTSRFHDRLVWCVDTHQTGLMCWHHSLSHTHTNTHTLYQRSSILIQCVLHCVSVCVCARARKREREMSGANLRIGKFSKASAGLLISIFYVSVTQVLRSIRKQPCGEQNFVSSTSANVFFLRHGREGYQGQKPRLFNSTGK